MKNKGMTLVELIVSIALISMVMVFLTKMLVSVSAKSLSVISKGQYKEAATILTKSIQDELLKEEVKYLYKCDSTDTCVKIVFESGNNLRVQIGSDKKTLEITKTSSNGTVISYEKKQTPVKEGETYVGRFDDLSYRASTLTPSDPNYDYEYKALMNLEFNIYDKQENPYLVEVSYPYDSGDLDLTNYLSGLESRINELETRMNTVEQAWSNIGTMYNTGVLLADTVVSGGATTVCQLTLENPGFYVLYGYVGANSWGSNTEAMCRFLNTNRNTWHPSNYIHTNKFCSASGNVSVETATTIDLQFYNAVSGTTKPVTSCYIQAIRIK